MNLIIKDTNMPSSCSDCFAYDDGDHGHICLSKCRITGYCMHWTFDSDKDRLASCPLLPYLNYDDDGNLVASEVLPNLYYNLHYGELESLIKHFED